MRNVCVPKKLLFGEARVQREVKRGRCVKTGEGMGETRISQELSGEDRNENQVFTYKPLRDRLIWSPVLQESCEGGRNLREPSL